MKEIWRDIQGYKGLYQASNLGRIKSLGRKVWNGYQMIEHSERILKPRINSKGYVFYALFKDGKRKDFKGHYLIANTFIKNPYNKPMVNHKDTKKDNNNVFNLEWCTNQENIIHAYENKLFKNRKRRYKFGKQDPMKCLGKYRDIAIEKAKQKNSKALLELDENGNVIKRFASTREAERFYGITIHMERKPKRFIRESDYNEM